jgi:hypothetical protein
MVFRRKGASTTEVSDRAKEIGAELHAGVDHLRNAAAATKDAARDRLAPTVEGARDHARELVEPRVDAAREAVKPAWDSALAALAPLVAAAVESQMKAQRYGRKAEKMTRPQRREAARRARATAMALRGERRRRWPWVAGALAVGTAAGVVGGALMGRSSRPEWESYDATEDDGRRSTLRAKAGQAQEKLAGTAHTVKDKMAVASGTVKEKASGAAQTAKEKLQTAREDTASKTAEKADTAATTAHEAVDEAASTAHKATEETRAAVHSAAARQNDPNFNSRPGS